jgi:hypothetical protein
MEKPDWMALKQMFPARLVEALQRHLRGGPFRIRASQLASEANAEEREATKLLDEVATLGLLSRGTQHTCPCKKAVLLNDSQAAEEICVECGRAFEADLHKSPIKVWVYIHQAQQTRDVLWLLALHGMNTTGAWQEAFNWLVSRSYGRSVPVAIYKYGVLRPGAIIKFRQRAQMRKLQARIRRLSGEGDQTGFGGVPDVIAHSFGTLLLAQALTNDSSLRVGRIILAGCIVRPDFDWAALMKRGQVQAVLCHTADRDFWARIAHYIIPNSGPSGRRGFNDRERIGHAILRGGRHSDFFIDDQMRELFQNTWEPFLTAPDGGAPPTATLPFEADWEQSWWPFRATVLRVLVLILLCGLTLAMLAAFALGSLELWRLCQTRQFGGHHIREVIWSILRITGDPQL